MLRKCVPALLLISGVALLVSLSACTKATSNQLVIAFQRAGDLTVTLSNSKGRLSAGDNEFTVEFKNAGGQPVDVGAITLTFDMPAMGSMAAMHSNAKLTTTQTPGVYQAHANIEMSGTWQVTVAYKGPAGEGKTNFTINTK